MELTNAAADQIAPRVRNLVELAAALHNLHGALRHSAEAKGIPLQGNHAQQKFDQGCCEERHQHA